MCIPCARRRGGRWLKQKRAGDHAWYLWQTAKARAAEQGERFGITVDDVRGVYPVSGRCPALGIPLTRGTGKQHDGSPTIDRLQGTWGYERGNIGVISLKANRAKGGLTARELEQIAAWMRRSGLD